jgi:hypothetical protein
MVLKTEVAAPPLPGGGPAGVVEKGKPPPGLLGAGVVLRLAWLEGADDPKTPFPPAVLPPPAVSCDLFGVEKPNPPKAVAPDKFWPPIPGDACPVLAPDPNTKDCEGAVDVAVLPNVFEDARVVDPKRVPPCVVLAPSAEVAVAKIPDTPEDIVGGGNVKLGLGGSDIMLWLKW